MLKMNTLEAIREMNNFEKSGYFGRMTLKEYFATNCVYCVFGEKGCPHKGAYRRMPRSVGGLGLCPNLKYAQEK